MPTPAVILEGKCRAGMLRGFETMARLLAVTLGPQQGTIVNTKVNSTEPEILRDAGTIVRRVIRLPDRVEDVGAMIMRHIVWHIRDEAGDGGATAAVLAQAIAREMYKMIVAGADPMILKRGIEKGTRAAIAALDELATPLEGQERIAGIATAAIGDAEIGRLLGEMYDVLGPHGQIVISPYTALTHDRAYHPGARLNGSYMSFYLLTDAMRGVAALDDTYVVVADAHLNSMTSVQNALEHVQRAGGKNLYIICRTMSDAAITLMALNNEKGTLKSTAARLNPTGDDLPAMLADVALLTGGALVLDPEGNGAPVITPQHLGYAERIVATREYVMIMGGRGDRQAIQEHVRALRQRLRSTTDPDAKERLRLSISRFSGGIGELRVGALTEPERLTRMELAAQAVRSVQVGIEGGMVPGGGAAYLAVIPKVEALEAEGGEAVGVRIVARALEEPMRCIATNAGAHAPLVIAECRRQGTGYGYDVRQKRVVPMVEQGIIDPASVVKRALQQAASGAVMLLTTEVLYLHAKPKETYIP